MLYFLRMLNLSIYLFILFFSKDSDEILVIKKIEFRVEVIQEEIVILLIDIFTIGFLS